MPLRYISWMADSKLKLNPSKTDFLLIGSIKHKSRFSKLFIIKLLNNDTATFKSARNLGVIYYDIIYSPKFLKSLSIT